MKAVILAGGLGTRLRPLTFSIPKPLLPVGEKPILEIIITKLKRFGFKEFIFAVGYKAELIETYFQDGSKFDVKISYIREKKPSGTAGSLALLKEQLCFIPRESFLLMNGDILTNLNFYKFIKYHKDGDFDMTIGTKKIRQKLSYGVMKVNDGYVRKIEEKPVFTYDVSAGIYIMKSSVLHDIPKRGFYTIPQLVRKLISQDKKVGCYYIKEYWLALEQFHHVEKAKLDTVKWIGK